MSSGCGDVLSLADLQTAKKHQLFEAEVITGKQGGVDGGADIDYATNQVTGQVQKTMPAVLRDAGFRPASFDFTTGGTLGINDRDKVVYDPVSKTWYSWGGSLPHVIAAGVNPVGVADWEPQTDPNLREDLASSAGTSLVGSPTGPLETRLTNNEAVAAANASNISKNFITSIIPCPTPTVGSSVKAVVKMNGDDDFYIIARKANGKSGFIATRVTNEVSPSDSANYGGASPFRPGSVDNIRDAFVAKLVPSAKGASVVLSSFTAAQISGVFGFSATGASINATTATGDFSLFSPQLYNIPNGSTVVYTLSVPKAVIRFGAYNTASASVQISISRNGTDWMLVDTINTLLPPAGSNPLPYDVNVNGLSGTWYLRIANAHANNATLAGLNIMPLGSGSIVSTGGSGGGDDILDYDNIMATIVPDLTSGPSYYFGGQGATEFAAKEASTGKFFGTYHGGHSNFLQRLRTDIASYNLDSGTAPVLVLTKSAVLHTSSTLSVGSVASYSYVASSVFGDGTITTSYSIQLTAGSPVLCERIYTHMATTGRNFNWIHHPIILQKDDDGDVPMGQAGFIQQFRAEDAAYVDCTFSQVNINNSTNGAYVSFQPNYNKQYYGPALNSTGYPVPTGTFTTCKSFY